MEYSTSNWNVTLPEEAIVFDLNSLYAWLLKLSDGRKRRGIRYPLALLLVMVILAKLGGEDGPKGMAEWLKFRIDFLVSHLKLRRASVPHPVTISRVLGLAVEVEEFENLIGAFFSQPSGSRAEQLGDDGWEDDSQHDPLGGDPRSALVGGLFA